MHTMTELKKPDFDKLYQIAEQQVGLFSAKQAKTAGYSLERLADLTKRGKFERLRRGIYRLTHFPSSSRYEHIFLALLQAGPESVLSHDSVLAMNELSDVIPSGVHVIVPRSASRAKLGLNIHTNKLLDDEITTVGGIRTTTIERAIADAIETGMAHQLAKQAIQQAIQRDLITATKLRVQAMRRKGLAQKYILEILKALDQ